MRMATVPLDLPTRWQQAHKLSATQLPAETIKIVWFFPFCDQPIETGYDFYNQVLQVIGKF